MNLFWTELSVPKFSSDNCNALPRSYGVIDSLYLMAYELVYNVLLAVYVKRTCSALHSTRDKLQLRLSILLNGLFKGQLSPSVSGDG